MRNEGAPSIAPILYVGGGPSPLHSRGRTPTSRFLGGSPKLGIFKAILYVYVLISPMKCLFIRLAFMQLEVLDCNLLMLFSGSQGINFPKATYVYVCHPTLARQGH